MEKKKFPLKPSNYWALLHEHFVNNYYNTTKSHPPDIYERLVYSLFLRILYFLPKTGKQQLVIRSYTLSLKEELIKGLQNRFVTLIKYFLRINLCTHIVLLQISEYCLLVSGNQAEYKNLQYGI